MKAEESQSTHALDSVNIKIRGDLSLIRAQRDQEDLPVVASAGLRAPASTIKMDSRQSRTFLPYLRGIDPAALRIGSLYLNPLNPDDGLEDKRFEFGQGIDQDTYEESVKKLCWKEQRDDHVSLEFGISKETAAGFHFSEWLHLQGEAANKVGAVLEGKAGRRLKLHWPQKFLKDKVMTQEGCDEWIRTQASVGFKGRFSHKPWKAPEIWMVTGVQMVKGGDVFAAGARNKKFDGGVGGDPSIAAGLPPGTLKIKVDGSHEHDDEANTGYQYEDDRVWAAQFMQIDIEYGTTEDLELQKREKLQDAPPKSISSFRLRDIGDLGARGIRGLSTQDVKPPKPFAHVVVEDVEEPEDPEGIQFDELPYVDALKGTSWEYYEKATRYMADEDRQLSSA